eukprot:jgi/Mesen1/6140/ME000314S05146
MALEQPGAWASLGPGAAWSGLEFAGDDRSGPETIGEARRGEACMGAQCGISAAVPAREGDKDCFCQLPPPGTTTFYGGSDASGTMGGACGFGNLYGNGYGVMTAAASIAMFNNGLICGACYEVRCIGSGCITKKTITVTVTNLCPQGSEGGWCNYPHKHLDLSMPAFTKLARPSKGVLTTQMRRVPCVKAGPIKFTIGGNPYFLQVTVTNVARDGDIGLLYVMGNREGWIPMTRNWGAVYTLSRRLGGKSLSFRIRTALTKQVLTVMDAAPKNWAFGGAYKKGQFPQPRPRRRRMV